MTVVSHIDPKLVDQAIDPNTATITKLLEKFHIPIRIVGGAVRDLLLHREPRDIDLVVDADPSTLIYLFEAHGIPVDLGELCMEQSKLFLVVVIKRQK